LSGKRPNPPETSTFYNFIFYRIRLTGQGSKRKTSPARIAPLHPRHQFRKPYHKFIAAFKRVEPSGTIGVVLGGPKMAAGQVW
jgi:hypothetical protein